MMQHVTAMFFFFFFFIAKLHFDAITAFHFTTTQMFCGFVIATQLYTYISHFVPVFYLHAHGICIVTN